MSVPPSGADIGRLHAQVRLVPHFRTCALQQLICSNRLVGAGEEREGGIAGPRTFDVLRLTTN